VNLEQTVTYLSTSLEARRKSLGLSQIELANLAGVSARFMYDLESGKKSVSLDKFLAVANVLGYELELTVAHNG
jgi:HTH-type transcriptional regulator/antitoxin HipB